MTTNLENMPIEDLWRLHEEIAEVLTTKIKNQKRGLEEKLALLGGEQGPGRHSPARKARTGRRPYPKVLPKYRNPSQPHETWAGRGKQPRWLRTQLKSGRKLKDFEIASTRHRA